MAGGGGWIRPLAQAPRGRFGPSTLPPPKCPTNQMTSIPEVILLGGGGTAKVTFLLFPPFPSFSCCTATKLRGSFLPASLC